MLQDEKVVDMEVTLNLDFSSVGAEGSKQRDSFEERLKKDLSNASDLPSTSFRVKSLSKGSVIVKMEVSPDAHSIGPNPADVVNKLGLQVKDPKSRLKSGVLTAYASNIQLKIPAGTPQNDVAATGSIDQAAGVDGIQAVLMQRLEIQQQNWEQKTSQMQEKIDSVTAEKKSCENFIDVLKETIAKQEDLISEMHAQVQANEHIEELTDVKLTTEKDALLQRLSVLQSQIDQQKATHDAEKKLLQDAHEELMLKSEELSKELAEDRNTRRKEKEEAQQTESRLHEELRLLAETKEGIISNLRDEYKKYVEEKAASYQQLNTKLEDLHAALEASRGETLKARARCDKLEGEVRALENAKEEATMQTQITVQEQQEKWKRRVLGRLMNRTCATAFEAWCDHTQDEKEVKASADAEAAKLRELYAALEEVKASADEDAAKLEELYAVLEASRGETLKAQARCDQLEGEVRALKNAKEEATMQTQITMQEELVTANANSAKLESQLQLLASRLQEQEEAAETALNATKTAHAEEAEAMCKELETQLHDLKEAAKSALSAAKEAHAEEINAMSAAKEAHAEEIKKLQKECEEARATTDQRDKVIEELQRELKTQLEETRDHHDQQFSELLQEFDAYKEETSDRHKQKLSELARQLEETHSSHDQVYSDLLKEFDAYKVEIGILHEQKLSEAAKNHDQQMTHLKHELEGKKLAVEKALLQKERMIEQNQSQDLSHLEQELDSKKSEIESALEEARAADHKIQQQHDQIQKLLQAKKTLRDDWEQAHKAQAVLENQLAELCRVVGSDTQNNNNVSDAASIRLAMTKDFGKADLEGSEERQAFTETLLHILSEAAGIPASNFRLAEIKESLPTALEEKVDFQRKELQQIDAAEISYESDVKAEEDISSESYIKVGNKHLKIVKADILICKDEHVCDPRLVARDLERQANSPTSKLCEGFSACEMEIDAVSVSDAIAMRSAFCGLQPKIEQLMSEMAAKGAEIRDLKDRLERETKVRETYAAELQSTSHEITSLQYEVDANKREIIARVLLKWIKSNAIKCFARWKVRVFLAFTVCTASFYM